MDVYDLAEEDRESLSDLEHHEGDGGVDACTAVDNFVNMNGDKFFVTE